MNIKTFFDPATFTLTYVVSDPRTGDAVVIDPVLDYDPLASTTSTHSVDQVALYLTEQGLKLHYVLETHAHADHLTGAHAIKERTGAPVGIGRHITAVQKTFAPLFEAADVSPDGVVFDALYTDGDRFPLGLLEVEVIHTPGHTPACVSYRIGDAVFVGDTLFMPDYGTARCDFPGGDARQLYRSIQRLFALPDSTRLLLCHDYLTEGREEHQHETTVAREREANVHVHDGVGEDAFVAMRNERDATLNAPALIWPSIQVNMRGGVLPEAEGNGVRYLRIPLNRM